MPLTGNCLILNSAYSPSGALLTLTGCSGLTEEPTNYLPQPEETVVMPGFPVQTLATSLHPPPYSPHRYREPEERIYKKTSNNSQSEYCQFNYNKMTR